MKRILRILLLGLLLFGARAALANPTLCSPGYQDSTCVTPISHGAIPAAVQLSGSACLPGRLHPNEPTFVERIELECARMFTAGRRQPSADADLSLRL
jgi:hypothetical protein